MAGEETKADLEWRDMLLAGLFAVVAVLIEESGLDLGCWPWLSMLDNPPAASLLPRSCLCEKPIELAGRLTGDEDCSLAFSGSNAASDDRGRGGK